MIFALRNRRWIFCSRLWKVLPNRKLRFSTLDFTSFLSIETGFGNVGLKDGKPFSRMGYYRLDVKKVTVSAKEQKL
jgi:hypothetical protein